MAAVHVKGVLLDLGVAFVLGDPGVTNSRREDLNHSGSPWVMRKCLVYLTQTWNFFARDIAQAHLQLDELI